MRSGRLWEKICEVGGERMVAGVSGGRGRRKKKKEEEEQMEEEK